MNQSMKEGLLIAAALGLAVAAAQGMADAYTPKNVETPAEPATNSGFSASAPIPALNASESVSLLR